jgi:hypothetical protein
LEVTFLAHVSSPKKFERAQSALMSFVFLKDFTCSGSLASSNYGDGAVAKRLLAVGFQGGISSSDSSFAHSTTSAHIRALRGNLRRPFSSGAWQALKPFIFGSCRASILDHFWIILANILFFARLGSL